MMIFFNITPDLKPLLPINAKDDVAGYDNLYTVNKIRRFYGKISGIWLPILLPLFYGRLPVEHFLISRYDRVMLTDSTRKYLCRIVGLYDKKKKQ